MTSLGPRELLRFLLEPHATLTKQSPGSKSERPLGKIEELRQQRRLPVEALEEAQAGAEAPRDGEAENGAR